MSGITRMPSASESGCDPGDHQLVEFQILHGSAHRWRQFWSVHAFAFHTDAFIVFDQGIAHSLQRHQFELQPDLQAEIF